MTDPNEPDAPIPAEQPAEESAPEWTLPNTAPPPGPAKADEDQTGGSLLGIQVD